VTFTYPQSVKKLLRKRSHAGWMAILSTSFHTISTGLLSRPWAFVSVYRQAMSEISGRLNDERLERHIQFLTECELSALQAGDRYLASRYDRARIAAIRCRSSKQIERMERAKGLR
jgi:hypothetical protein